MGFDGGKMFKKYVLALIVLMCGMLASVGFVEPELVDADVFESVSVTQEVDSSEDISNKSFVATVKSGAVFEIKKDMEIENVHVELQAKFPGAVFKVGSGASVTFRNIVVTGEEDISCSRLVQAEANSQVVLDGFESNVNTTYISRNYGEMLIKDFVYTGNTSKGLQNGEGGNSLQNYTYKLTIEHTNITDIFANPNSYIVVNANTKLENEIKISLNGKFTEGSLVVKGDGVYAGCFMDKFKLESKTLDLDYCESDGEINGVSKGDLYLVENGKAKVNRPDWLMPPTEPTVPTPEEPVEPTPVEPVVVEVRVEQDEFEYNGLDRFRDIKVTYEYDEITYDLELEKVEVKNAGEYELNIVFNVKTENYGLITLDKESVIVKIKKKEVFPKLKTSEFVYNGQVPDLEVYFDEVLEGDKIEYTFKRESTVNVGDNYGAIVELKDSENYCIPLDKKSVSYKITKATIDESKIHFEDISKEYDGKEIVFEDKDICDDLIHVEYVTNGKRIVNCGRYIVNISLKLLDKENYTELKKSEYGICVNISKREITPRLKVSSFIYSGLAPSLEIVFINVVEKEEIKYTYIADENVYAGGHEVEVELDYSDPQTSNYILSPIGKTMNYNISKKVVDTSGCKFEDKAIEFGEEVEIKVENLPSEIRVEYKNIPSSKVVGTYDIIAEFKLEDSHNFSLDKESMCMKLDITPKKINVSELRLGDAKGVYTGNMYTIEPPKVEGIKFTPKGKTQFSDVGEHEIIYIISSLNSNYEVVGKNVELKATLKITPADFNISNIEFKDVEIIYDGKEHGIDYSGELPDGLETLACKKYVSVGEHEIVLNFKSTNPNYSTPLPKTATLKISPREVQITLKKDTFVYTGESVTLSCNVSGVLDGDMVAVELDYTKSKNVGEYIASIKSLSHSGYVGNTKTFSYSIVKAKSDISNLNFPSEEIIYSGEKYIPKVYGTIPEYLTYEIVEDKEIRNVGEYEIRVKFKADKNHKTPEDLVAEIKVLPRGIHVYFSDYMDLKYTGEKQRITISVVGILDNEGVVVEYSEPPIEAGNYTCRVTLKENSNYIILGDNTCVFNIYLEQKEVVDADYSISIEGGMFTEDSEVKIQSTTLNKSTKQNLDAMYENLDVCECFKILSESQENEVKFKVSLNTLNLNSAYVLYLVSQTGELTKLDYALDENTLIFNAPTNSTFVLLKEKTQTSKALYLVLISLSALGIAISIVVCVLKKRRPNPDLWD